MAEEYYIYFDDSGIRFPDKQQPNRNDGMDHFALGGILLKKSDRAVVIEGYKELCEKWKITYPLRSSDIRGSVEIMFGLRIRKCMMIFLKILTSIYVRSL